MQLLSQAIEQYLGTCEYERNLSTDTLKAYRTDLRQFLKFTEYEWADQALINQYIKHLNQNFAPRSIKRKVASLRAFYHDQEFNGLLQENPFHRLQVRIRSPKQLPRTIQDHIVYDLLQSAYDNYSPGKRTVLRDIVAGSWNGYSIHSIFAGSQLYLHDPNLYPCYILSADCPFGRKTSTRQNDIFTLNRQAGHRKTGDLLDLCEG